MSEKKFNIADMLNSKEPLIAKAFEEFALIARLQKIKYDALIAEGFTPDQAIKLLKL